MNFGLEQQVFESASQLGFELVFELVSGVLFELVFGVLLVVKYDLQHLLFVFEHLNLMIVELVLQRVSEAQEAGCIQTSTTPPEFRSLRAR